MAADLAREAAQPGAMPQLVPVVDRDGRPELAAHPTSTGAMSRPSIPATISIPKARIKAPIDEVGSTASGLVLPNVGRAGWWDGGPRPGENGRAVIVGHLDSKKGPDVFARVPDLAPGDRIEVRDQVGESHEYAVVGVTSVPKAQFPKDDVYGPAPRPVLVLVTCGGPYDQALGHYRDNVLVYARGV
jgi:LPXTG-site transpeptidase (sortase) family protein